MKNYIRIVCSVALVDLVLLKFEDWKFIDITPANDLGIVSLLFEEITEE